MEEHLEAAELELEDLIRLNKDHEEAKRRGKNPDKLPFFIENMQRAVKKYSELLEEYE